LNKSQGEKLSTTSTAGAIASGRTLRVHSEALAQVQGQALLEPVRLSGREGINSLFEYELLLHTTSAFVGARSSADLDLDGFIGREICCSIALEGAGTREISALITDAAFVGPVGRQLQYRLTLRPWLHLATLSTDCRIFQNQTVVQILEALLADYHFPVEKRLYGLEGAAAGSYPTRDYQTQFNESDFAFFERLCQEWGISYHFEHSQGKHRLVLSDAMAAFRPNEGEMYQRVEYHPPGWKLDAEYLHGFTPAHHIASGRYTSRDYDYTRPKADLTTSRAQPRPTAQADGEVYEWHRATGGSHWAQPDAGAGQPNDPLEEGRLIALLRMQALRTPGNRAQGSGHLRGMQPGHTFKLARHPQERANAEYLILETTFLIENVAQDTQAADVSDERTQQWRFDVDLVTHPTSETLRPALTYAKPFSHGPQSALVVGPEGQNLWTDALGRIKVQFPWDRIGHRLQRSA